MRWGSEGLNTWVAGPVVSPSLAVSGSNSTRRRWQEPNPILQRAHALYSQAHSCAKASRIIWEIISRRAQTYSSLGLASKRWGKGLWVAASLKLVLLPAEPLCGPRRDGNTLPLESHVGSSKARLCPACGLAGALSTAPWCCGGWISLWADPHGEAQPPQAAGVRHLCPCHRSQCLRLIFRVVAEAPPLRKKDGDSTRSLGGGIG